MNTAISLLEEKKSELQSRISRLQKIVADSEKSLELEREQVASAEGLYADIKALLALAKGAVPAESTATEQ